MVSSCPVLQPQWWLKDIIQQCPFISDQIYSWTVEPRTCDVRPGETNKARKANEQRCGVVKLVAQHPKVKSIPYREPGNQNKFIPYFSVDRMILNMAAMKI